MIYVGKKHKLPMTHHFKTLMCKLIFCLSRQMGNFKRLISLMVVCAAFMHIPALSQPSEQSAMAAKAVVQGQLAAFAKDDAELAFSFAAPDIKAVFKTPQNFIQMVISSYPAVYRPAKVIFLKPLALGPELLLPVQLTDFSGKAWLAQYSLQQQADGKWLINGCILSEDQSPKINAVAPRMDATFASPFVRTHRRPYPEIDGRLAQSSRALFGTML